MAIAKETGEPPHRSEMVHNAICWLLGIALVYSVMFATGAFLFREPRPLALFGTIAAASGVALTVLMQREEE